MITVSKEDYLKAILRPKARARLSSQGHAGARGSRSSRRGHHGGAATEKRGLVRVQNGGEFSLRLPDAKIARSSRCAII